MALRLEQAIDSGKLKELWFWLSKGTPVVHACAIVGIPVATYYRWRNLSKEGKPGYDGIDERAAKAEAGLAQKAETVFDVILEGKDDRTKVKLLTWRLEKRFPQQYGPQGSLKIEGAIGDKKLDISAVVEAISKAGQNGGGNGEPEEEDEDGPHT